ncbi:MAG: DUF4185 domain-containing protein [Spirochaetes bacterium]|nr:DUF4185 domain-containing protein [Spirochaetota bacterium]
MGNIQTFKAALFSILVISISVFSICSPRVEPMGLFAPSRLNHVIGQDGVAPIPFRENLLLWSFGDTIIGKWKNDILTYEFREKAIVEEMLPNSLGFTTHITKDSIANLKFEYYREDGKIVPFLRLAPGENPYRIRLWALDGIRLQNRVYVFYVKIRIDEPGKPFAFTSLGTGVARWDVPHEWKKGMRVHFKRKDGIFSSNEPVFGGSVFEKDGFLFITGQKTHNDFKSYGYIARVPKEYIDDRSKYEFFSTEKTWTSDLQRALPLFGDVAGEWTLSYNHALNAYIGVYCRFGKNEIALAKFSDFNELVSSPAKTVYNLPDLDTKRESHQFYYSAKEVYSNGNEIYVIYINPIEYQPYLVRIRL